VLDLGLQEHLVLLLGDEKVLHRCILRAASVSLVCAHASHTLLDELAV
jgi:hypothetical protein